MTVDLPSSATFVKVILFSFFFHQEISISDIITTNDNFASGIWLISHAVISFLPIHQFNLNTLNEKNENKYRLKNHKNI